MNEVLVADAFPDWYPTLQGSRVSVNPQTQTQTQPSDKSVYSYSNSLASSSGARPRDHSSTTNVRPLNSPMTMGRIDLTANTDTNIVGSQISTQSNASSPIRMDEEAPSSPSLLNPVPHPSVPKDKSPKPVSGNPPDSPPPSTRGRSPTRKNVTRSRPRNQSVASRGSARDRSTKRPTARSLSIGPHNDYQAAGGSNFKKPGPSVAFENNGKKKDNNNPKQSEPQPSNNSQK